MPASNKIKEMLESRLDSQHHVYLSKGEQEAWGSRLHNARFKGYEFKTHWSRDGLVYDLEGGQYFLEPNGCLRRY